MHTYRITNKGKDQAGDITKNSETDVVLKELWDGPANAHEVSMNTGIKEKRASKILSSLSRKHLVEDLEENTNDYAR